MYECMNVRIVFTDFGWGSYIRKFDPFDRQNLLKFIQLFLHEGLTFNTYLPIISHVPSM
jgi:hypothetical protein